MRKQERMPFKKAVKNYSADFSAKGVPPSPNPCPLSGKSFCRKSHSGNGGTYTDFTTNAASEKKSIG